jgi:hypothetical protein
MLTIWNLHGLFQSSQSERITPPTRRTAEKVIKGRKSEHDGSADEMK